MGVGGEVMVVVVVVVVVRGGAEMEMAWRSCGRYRYRYVRQLSPHLGSLEL